MRKLVAVDPNWHWLSTLGGMESWTGRRSRRRACTCRICARHSLRIRISSIKMAPSVCSTIIVVTLPFTDNLSFGPVLMFCGIREGVN